ncbi:MAG TPA: hypothetical protein PKA37_10895 [Planctomycetota bacterium]|nr:hypothetical protein [Planctomycetota bacterium]
MSDANGQPGWPLSLCLAGLLIVGVRRVADVVTWLAHVPIVLERCPRKEVMEAHSRVRELPSDRAVQCPASVRSRFLPNGVSAAALLLAILACLGWPLSTEACKRPLGDMSLAQMLLPPSCIWPVAACVLLVLTRPIQVSNSNRDVSASVSANVCLTLGLLLFLLLETATLSAGGGAAIAWALRVGSASPVYPSFSDMSPRWEVMVAPVGFLAALVVGAFGLGLWTRPSERSKAPLERQTHSCRGAAYCALLASQFLGGGEILPQVILDGRANSDHDWGRRCLGTLLVISGSVGLYMMARRWVMRSPVDTRGKPSLRGVARLRPLLPLFFLALLCGWEMRQSLAPDLGEAMGAMVFLIKALSVGALMSWIRVSYGTLTHAGFRRLFWRMLLPLALLQQVAILSISFLMHLS